MTQKQTIKALRCCAKGRCSECPVDKSKQDDCVCMSFLAGQALSLVRHLKKEKDAAIHKTLARVKIKLDRVSYADMAVPGVYHEIFTVKGNELEEIEKELLHETKDLSKKE